MQFTPPSAFPHNSSHFSCYDLLVLLPQLIRIICCAWIQAQCSAVGEIIPRKRAGGNCGAPVVNDPSVRDPSLVLPVIQCQKTFAFHILSSFVFVCLMVADIFHTSDCIVSWSRTPIISKQHKNKKLPTLFFKSSFATEFFSTPGISLSWWFLFLCSYYFFPI